MNSAVTTRQLAPPDLDAMMPLLVDAFESDPGFRYIVPDEKEWQRIGQRYFSLMLRQTIDRGHGIVESGGHAVSLWEPPLPSVSRVGELTQFMRLAMLLRRNLGRALNIQRFVEGFRPRRPHWYLTYIASAPEHQGQGFGSRVLEPMLELTDRARLPIYLECSNRDNVGFYVRHGFNIVAEVAIPETGHTIWPMLREPREA